LAITSGVQADFAVAAARYERKNFGRKIGLLNAYRKLFQCSFVPPIVFDGTKFCPASMERQMEAMETGPELFHRLDELERLSEWARRAGLRHREIALVHYAAEELRYKYQLALAHHEWRIGNGVDVPALRRDHNAMRAMFRKTFANVLTPCCYEQEMNLRFGADETWLKSLSGPI